MQTKFKIILVTVVCTTIGWVIIIAVLLFLSEGKGPAAIVQLPRPGDPSLAEWQSQEGEFIVRLVSSNITTSASSVLFSHTSRPSERIWFESLKAPATKR